MSPLQRIAASASAALVLILTGAARAGDPLQRTTIYPDDGFPELTEADRTITDVPFDPGAPAVVLLEAVRYRWEDIDRIRSDYYRRVKILNASGASEHADYQVTYRGAWRIKEVEARTVLADGTSVDAASGVFVEKSKETKREELRIAFPQAAVGTILDLHVVTMVDVTQVPPWRIQGDLPVLRSEFLFRAPPKLRFRKLLFSMGENKGTERTWGVPGQRMTAWTWENVPTLPDVPNRPPDAEIAGQLFLIVESYADSGLYYPVTSDWKSYLRSNSDYLKEWLKRGHARAAALAR